MLLLKSFGKPIEVLAPIKVTIDEYPAGIGSGEFIEIRNEIRSRTNTGCDVPDDQNNANASVDETFSRLPLTCQSQSSAYPPSIAKKG